MINHYPEACWRVMMLRSFRVCLGSLQDPVKKSELFGRSTLELVSVNIEMTAIMLLHFRETPDAARRFETSRR